MTGGLAVPRKKNDCLKKINKKAKNSVIHIPVVYVRCYCLKLIISKYHSWYLCQISLQIMLLPIQILVTRDTITNASIG